MLRDTAYTPSNFMVPPYKAPYTFRPKNQKFNKWLSSIQIDIKHMFGMLKGRWKSLIGLRLFLTNHSQYEYTSKWIIGCIVLHNILLDLKDIWAENEGWWSEENIEKHDKDLLQLSKQKQIEGADKREMIKNMVLA